MARWLIEVRDDTTGNRTNVVNKWTNLTVVERYNKLGAWSVTGPIDALRPLLVPTVSVVLSRAGQQVMSGPVIRMLRQGDKTATVGGADDKQWLADRLVYPNPGLAIGAQTAEVDQRTGARETTILGLINDNAGPAALVPRRTPRLRLPTTLGRGGTADRTSKLENLLVSVADIAEAGGLAVNVVHTEDGVDRWLDVVITAVTDRSATVRFGPAEAGGAGLLTEDWSYTVSRPTANQVIVGGSYPPLEYDLDTFEPITPTTVLRKYREVGDTDSQTLWGRRVESFTDQSSTSEEDQLEQAGTDAIAEGGKGSVEFTATVADVPDLGYRTDWRTGDKVGITLDGVEIVDVVREVTTTVQVQAGEQDEKVQPTIGSADATSPATQAAALAAPTQKALVAALRRLSNLERRR